ncbi:nucleotidyltransferase [Streptomyces tendae]|uniref:nucleotidyltransferase n=1 Tax=Streptomyces tendae TaxID=1932 RepID=UPI0013307E8A|nr:nucleotidyltransferase [Streptomyces tendae]
MVRKESLAQLLDEGRRKIQVTDEELAEAKRRRRLLAASVRRAFAGSTAYFNGSVAHGDANTPLTDVDLGVVLTKKDAEPYGPGKKSALTLMEIARDAIHEDIGDEFPKLTIEVEGRRRAILVRFGDPVTPGQADFTADVMTAIPHPSGRGLYIPNTKIAAQWDRADPITHTRMVLQAIEDTKVVFARTVRLLKHWNGTHSKPMCSWNLKALCLNCLDEPMPLINALQVFFTYAADEIDKRPTPDPAGVAGPIPLNMPRADVYKRLCTARKYIDLAIEHEKDGRPVLAQHTLHQVLPELVAKPDATEEEADRLARAVRSGGPAATGLGLATGLVTTTRTRAWGD